MDRTGTTQRPTTAELGARKIQFIAQSPEERRLWVDVEVVWLAVDV
jgi:hypothetical protein